METIKRTVTIGEDGSLTITLKTPFPNQRVEMLIVLQPASETHTQPAAVDVSGLPMGYFAETHSPHADEVSEVNTPIDIVIRESFAF